MKKLIAIAALVLGTSGLAFGQAQTSVKYKEVDRSRQKVVATRTDGVRDTFLRTTTSAVPYDQQYEQVVNGKRVAYDPSFHDVQGILRRGWYAGWGGNGLYNISNSNVVGGPNAVLGAWFGRWTIEAEFIYLFGNAYPLDGTAAGDHYNSPGANLKIGYDLWSSNMYDQRFTLLLGGGYQHQKTDYRNAQFESANYGFGFLAQARYSKTIGRWNFSGGPEVRALPQVKATGGSQQFKWAVGLHFIVSFRGNK